MFFTDIWPPGLFMSLKCIIIIIIIIMLSALRAKNLANVGKK